MEATLILGNQLFDLRHYKDFPNHVVMIEAHELCVHFKYHKHKIIHFLASMREYADELIDKGFQVTYFPLADNTPYLETLQKFVEKNKVKSLNCFEVEDKFFEAALTRFGGEQEVEILVRQSPMFMCSREEFREFLNGRKSALMNDFYIEQRKKRKILMDGDKPLGGKWNFDQANRKKIPKSSSVTKFLPPMNRGAHVKDVAGTVERFFSEHPGKTQGFWIPTNRKDYLKFFKDYLNERFELFGDYQDALDQRNPFLYHSLISPALNIGFLTPDEIVGMVKKLANKKNLNAVEGFIRQILGWREFVRGIYQNFDEIQQKENFFGHKRKLADCWYEGSTGVPPLDDALSKTFEWGYCHHIERLMVLGNLMLLLEVDPKEVYRWFMEMFVDSSDWVMGPNVFGMSQFSDGGLFATKPYISGSNYILKMGHYQKGDWSQGWDGLYWRFIDRKREILARNRRMSMMVSMYDKMDEKKKKALARAAEKLEKKLTRA